jgi:hypothetical protein
VKLTALLEAAQTRGDLSAADVSSIAGHFAREDEHASMPWYLHALLAIGAWFAAIFFMGFFAAVFSHFFQNGGAAVTLGIIVIAASVLVRRTNCGAFLNQLCLAFSVAGHVLLFIGISDLVKWPHDLTLVTLTAFALSAILYFLYEDSLHRFLSTGSALALSTLWLATAGKNDAATPCLVHASVLAHTIGISLIFLRTATPRKFLPLGYAVAISLVAVVLTFEVHWFGEIGLWISVPPSIAILTIAFLALSVWVAGGLSAFRKNPVAFILLGCGIAALGMVTNPTILVALGFLLIGFALQDRAFLILGAILLPVFLSFYYYNLRIDLMRKSEVLAASGALLLVLRAVVARMFWKPESAQ